MGSTKKVTILLLVFAFGGCATGLRSDYQNDADLIRLEHLAYWSGLIEEYREKNDSYPLQDLVGSDGNPVLVKIATRQQAKQLSTFMEHFESASMASFVRELESGLGREIEERYDIQRIPVKSPVGYYYFATNDGYVLWVTCITCGVTQISTLLMDGFTPTVNVVSPSMTGKVTKALPRNEMLNHATYQSWISRPFNKEEYVRGIVESNIKDSKQP
ncbi:hypothetical protein MWU49_17180 [Alcanivorax sp. S6407]|uniref:hypothetical protein n=1 Tax=Alcanivorax sp. S6407 TaxID=2926424 RepID=UPI001FF56F72|nr:hypothetical protein [Alcanivorax sp. S6407]MCK0155452.1 hypothetical protein [Alcanivorax sp. S6407]